MSEELNKGDAAFNALARARSRNSKFRNQTTPKDVQDLAEVKKLEVVHILINAIHSF